MKQLPNFIVPPCMLFAYSYMKIVVCDCVAWFQQNVIPRVRANSTDVSCLLEQVRTTRLIITVALNNKKWELLISPDPP